MEKVVGFRNRIGNAGKEELWALIEFCMDDGNREIVYEELKQDVDFFEKELVELVCKAETKSQTYFLQWLNLMLSMVQDFLHYLDSVVDSDSFCKIQRMNTVDKFDSQFFKFNLILIFNYLKQKSTDPKADISCLIQVCKANKPSYIDFTIPSYFNNFEKLEAENDSHYEWIIYLYNLLIETQNNDTSIFEWLYNRTKAEKQTVLFNFYVMNIDAKISAKNSYSLIIDMKADMLENDEDFSKRVNKDDNSIDFSIKKSDLQFVLQLCYKKFYIPLEDNNLAIIHETIKLLVGVTFIGRYNKAVQDLVNDNFKFLGSLSLFMKSIGESKVRNETTFRRPELASDIIRLASNLIHANIKTQDFLLDNHFVGFYLAHTNRDDLNLYGKEVTVVFVRYITESNHRARDYIRELKVEDFIRENANFVKKFDDI